jgi:hypothetical protein
MIKTNYPFAINMARKMIKDFISSPEWQEIPLEDQRQWLKLRKDASPPTKP